MVAQTGNTYLSGITIDSVEISTKILKFSQCEFKECAPNDCVTTENRK